MNLRETLRGIPKSLFFKKGRSGAKVPDYNGIFAYCLRKANDDNPRLDLLCRRIEVGEGINVSTFQRVVALERQRREGARSAKNKAR